MYPRSTVALCIFTITNVRGDRHINDFRFPVSHISKETWTNMTVLWLQWLVCIPSCLLYMSHVYVLSKSFPMMTLLLYFHVNSSIILERCLSAEIRSDYNLLSSWAFVKRYIDEAQHNDNTVNMHHKLYIRIAVTHRKRRNGQWESRY